MGKAKRLKNRVSQYFQDSSSHSVKTRMMVSQIDSFDVIVAQSEFEALVLECSLIKRHMPRYNISAQRWTKGIPYLRVDVDGAVSQSWSSWRTGVVDDGADLFRPLRRPVSVTQHAIDTIRLSLSASRVQQEISAGCGEGAALPQLPSWGTAPAGARPICSALGLSRARMDQAICCCWKGSYGEVRGPDSGSRC